MQVELVKSQEIRVPYVLRLGHKAREPEIPATAERKARIRAHARRIRAELGRRRKLYGAWSV